MNNEMNLVSWNGFAASVPGFGHIRHGIPCQDASAVHLGEYPAVIVCDGRGSAKLSHLGAQEAVVAFKKQAAILMPFISNILDAPDTTQEMWDKFCKILFRTLMQVKLDLAEIHNCSEKEFDFTVALAIVGKEHIGCFQVGDGALVLWSDSKSMTVFSPDKGEFANQTHFLRLGGENNNGYHAKLFSIDKIEGVCATSDGPEHLMFHLESMTPGKIFDKLFSDLSENELYRQDLMDYLTRKEWNNDPRGADDRSIAIIAKVKGAKNAAENEINDVFEKKSSEYESADNDMPFMSDSSRNADGNCFPMIKKDAASRITCQKFIPFCCIAILLASSILNYRLWAEIKIIHEDYNQALSSSLSQFKEIYELSNIKSEQLSEEKECGSEKLLNVEPKISVEEDRILTNSTNSISF